MLVVEVRQGPLQDEEEEERRRRRRRRRRRKEGRKEGRKEATNIKSNNPHLAGGEKRLSKSELQPRVVLALSTLQLIHPLFYAAVCISLSFVLFDGGWRHTISGISEQPWTLLTAMRSASVNISKKCPESIAAPVPVMRN